MDQSLYYTNSDVYCYAVDLAEGVDFGVFFFGELCMHACMCINIATCTCMYNVHASFKLNWYIYIIVWMYMYAIG